MKTQLTLCISGTLLLVGMSGCEKTPERPMNVVYILADDLGYGDVGCYGQQIIKTPNIDRMAKEGMLFTQHYAGCTVSAPSRCCCGRPMPPVQRPLIHSSCHAGAFAPI